MFSITNTIYTDTLRKLLLFGLSSVLFGQSINAASRVARGMRTTPVKYRNQENANLFNTVGRKPGDQDAFNQKSFVVSQAEVAWRTGRSEGALADVTNSTERLVSVEPAILKPVRKSKKRPAPDLGHVIKEAAEVAAVEEIKKAEKHKSDITTRLLRFFYNGLITARQIGGEAGRPNNKVERMIRIALNILCGRVFINVGGSDDIEPAVLVCKNRIASLPSGLSLEPMIENALAASVSLGDDPKSDAINIYDLASLFLVSEVYGHTDFFLKNLFFSKVLENRELYEYSCQEAIQDVCKNILNDPSLLREDLLEEIALLWPDFESGSEIG